MISLLFIGGFDWNKKPFGSAFKVLPKRFKVRIDQRNFWDGKYRKTTLITQTGSWHFVNLRPSSTQNRNVQLIGSYSIENLRDLLHNLHKFLKRRSTVELIVYVRETRMHERHVSWHAHSVSQWTVLSFINSMKKMFFYRRYTRHKTMFKWI